MAINQSTPRRLQTQPGYSDISTNFSQHPIQRDVSLLLNEDAVKRSLRNILLTSKGERLIDPDFGAGLTRYLFEPLIPSTVQIIKTEIKNAIETYEPRVLINKIDVSGDTAKNELRVSITFSTTNITEPQSLEVILDRVR